LRDYDSSGGRFSVRDDQFAARWVCVEVGSCAGRGQELGAETEKRRRVLGWLVEKESRQTERARSRVPDDGKSDSQTDKLARRPAPGEPLLALNNVADGVDSLRRIEAESDGHWIAGREKGWTREAREHISAEVVTE